MKSDYCESCKAVTEDAAGDTPRCALCMLPRSAKCGHPQCVDGMIKELGRAAVVCPVCVAAGRVPNPKVGPERYVCPGCGFPMELDSQGRAPKICPSCDTETGPDGKSSGLEPAPAGVEAVPSMMDDPRPKPLNFADCPHDPQFVSTGKTLAGVQWENCARCGGRRQVWEGNTDAKLAELDWFDPGFEIPAIPYKAQMPRENVFAKLEAGPRKPTQKHVVPLGIYEANQLAEAIWPNRPADATFEQLKARAVSHRELRGAVSELGAPGPKIICLERATPLKERLAKAIIERIHEDIGTASMCWNPRPGKQIFDSESAGAVALNLCNFIADKLEEARKEANLIGKQEILTAVGVGFVVGVIFTGVIILSCIK